MDRESPSAPATAVALTRMLDSYIKSVHYEHKGAVNSLRDALDRLKTAKPDENALEPNWPLRLKIVALYNIAVESMNMHLRTDAISYISRAETAVSLYKTGLSSYARRVDGFKQALLRGRRRDLSDDSSEEEAPAKKRPVSQRLRRVTTNGSFEKIAVRPKSSVRKAVYRSQSKPNF